NNPTVSVSASRVRICRGETNTLTATGATTYSWSGGSTNSGSTLTISPITSTLITVIGIDENGCENATSYQALVNPCLGVAEDLKGTQTVLVFPNPNHGKFTVKADAKLLLEMINNL